MMDTESVLYFYPGNIDDIPQTEYSLQPMGCLMCNYETNMGSNLVSHLKKHRVEADDLTKSVHKSITYNLNSIFMPMDMINSSTSSSKAQGNEKVSSNAGLHSAHKQKSVDKYIQSTQYNSLNVPEALANVSEPSTTNAGFKELPPVKQTDVDEQVLSTQYNTLSVLEALARVSKPSTTIAGFKELPPVKHTNVDKQVQKTQYNMFNISNAFASVAELSKIAGFKELPPVKQTDVDEHVLSAQCNTLNVPEVLSSVTESSITIAGFKDLQPTNKQKNVDQHIPSTQNSMFNFPEALDCVTELLSTIAGFKEIPIKSTTIGSTSIKAIDVLVSEVQEKILSYPSRNPNGYLTLIRCIGKYTCPVCNMFITEKEQSFHEHLLKEINGEIWECLKCFAISDSVEKMESHVIKHTLDKRNYEKIEFCNKNIWVNRIIEYQNILIEYVRLKRNN